MFRGAGLGFILACSISSSGLAADIYHSEPVSFKDTPIYAAPHIWQGFYLGANIGYGWSANDSAAIDVLGPPGGIYPLTADYDTDFEGILGGGQLGFNLQRGKWVFGIEADIQASDFSAGNDILNPFDLTGRFAASTLETDLEIDWFGTLRARLGVALDRTLLYATGGLAFGHVELANVYSTPFPATVSLGSDDTEYGWTAGAGIEQALGGGWTLKAEYLYVDLGSVEGSATFFDETYKTEADVAFHSVRVGVNYLFGGRDELLK